MSITTFPQIRSAVVYFLLSCFIDKNLKDIYQDIYKRTVGWLTQKCNLTEDNMLWCWLMQCHRFSSCVSPLANLECYRLHFNSTSNSTKKSVLVELGQFFHSWR